MSMNSKLNFILIELLVFGGLIFLESNLDAQVLPSRIIEFENTPLPPSKVWSLVEKMDENDDLLRNLPLNVSTKSLDFYENRITQSGDKIFISRKKITEHNKDIGMKIMNTDTGEVRVIKVSIKVQKDGIELISPSGYKIDILERASGIRWNRWNTLYKIVSPQGWLVLKNKYPNVNEKTQKVTIKDKAGKKRTISKKFYTVEEFVYSPYSGELHTPELVEAGREYLKSVIKVAMTDLKGNQVPSRTVMGQLVADIPSLSPDFFAHLPILEHTDFGEFLSGCLNGDYDQSETCLDSKQKSVERVLVLIGANKEVAFQKTGSKAGALGWVQFTDIKGRGKNGKLIDGTYTTIRKAYPSAKLITDFETGAGDHLNSMKAAILLYDYNLDYFTRKYGNKILDDPRLEEYLAAAYNGGPSRTSASLKASIAANLSDWVDSLSSKKGGLASETKGYMTKIRYLNEQGLP